MTGWTVKTIPAAAKEIKALAADLQDRFLRVSGYLEEFGPARVGMPHVKRLQAGLWQMRLQGRDGIARAIYFAASGRRLIVVRAFVKKTQSTPKREIDLAVRRMKEWRDG